MDEVTVTIVATSFAAGILVTMLVGAFLVSNKLKRIRNNVNASDELVRFCHDRQTELMQVVYRASWVKLLKYAHYDQLFDWSLKTHPSIQDLPDGKIVVIRTDDLKAQERHFGAG